MSALNDLVAQIEDANLRERIAKEVERLAKQKKFGLVFEDHLPECSPLYDIPVKVGAQVARKTERVNDIYRVLGIKEGVAECLHKESKEVVTLPVAELVAVAEFGEPIYPYLKPLDCVSNSPESDLWHTLIEADNYHALQLLEYLYAGKVDCIYIDPPLLSASAKIASPCSSKISPMGRRLGRLEIEAATSPSFSNTASQVPMPSSVARI